MNQRVDIVLQSVQCRFVAVVPRYELTNVSPEDEAYEFTMRRYHRRALVFTVAGVYDCIFLHNLDLSAF